MKIHYKAIKMSYGVKICETRCPFHSKKGALATRVGSVYCHGCPNFIRDNEDEMILTCGHAKPKDKKKK